MKTLKRVFPLLVLLAVTLSSCSVLPILKGKVTNAVSSSLAQPVSTATPAPTLPVVPSAFESLAAYQSALEKVYQEVSPSVVNIEVTQKQTSSIQGFQIPQVPGFPQIPGLPFGEPDVQNEPITSLGSGFVWDKDGHIVTNNHVVANAEKITVTFADGTIVDGKVVGSDPDSDLAVIKVDVASEKLKPVALADSRQVRVGQLAIAIGSPFGLEGSMTVGIVSALGRSLPSNESAAGPTYTIPDVIQTDAPINPGNSGGVLVNVNGQVIGVTSAIESPVRANAGIGFAIPASIVQRVVPFLIRNGRYEHPWLGISGRSLNPDLAKAMDLPENQRGILVIDVTLNSPADKAGVKGSTKEAEIEGRTVRVGGDVITAIDGQPVREFDDLAAYLASNASVGQKVTLNILRNGQEHAIEVTLAARPSSGETQTQSKTTRQAWLGISGIDVTPEIARAMDLPANTHGVLIEQVTKDSPADQAGIMGSDKPFEISGKTILIGGDIITAINGQSISGMIDLKTAISQMEPGQKVILNVLRKGDTIKIEVILGEKPVS